MSNFPFAIRLLVAICPEITLHYGHGKTKKYPLSKVINVGKEKLERTLRKVERKRLETP